MTTEEAIRVISGSEMLLVRVKEHRDAVGIALNALKTSDKAVEQAINTIAKELFRYVSCDNCPCDETCGELDKCSETLEVWMKELTE